VCFELLEEGLRRLRNPVIPDITIVSFAVMVVTLFINIVVMRYERRQGQKLQSDILVADALHTRADILTSLSVIASFIAIRFGFHLMDAVVTFVIAIFIAYAAYGIFRDSSRILCDSAVIMDTSLIEQIVLRVSGVKSCHKIRTRGRPDDINLDLHVQLDEDIHLGDAHKISDEIESTLQREIPGLSDVVVHLEPREEGH
jgi:cation diffusion facilitator family transporter